jgi:hypothetical protein
MFLRKFVKKFFNKEKKKKKRKAKHDCVFMEQNHIEYVKSDDFEIFTYEEVNPNNFVEEYMQNTLSGRNVIISIYRIFFRQLPVV